MKNTFVCVIICVLFFVSPVFPVAAEPQKMGTAVNETIMEQENRDVFQSDEKSEIQRIFAHHSFELSLMYHKFDYKEDLPAPHKSTENGWLPGLYLGWSYNKKNSLTSKVFLEFSSGEVEYDGTTQSGRPITFSEDNHQFLFRGEVDVGYNFAVTNAISLTPYAGYGYRYWKRGQTAVTSNYTSIMEKYYWHYIPVGMQANVTIGEKLSVEPNAGLRIMFYGRMTSYDSELNPGYNNPTFKLGNKIGWYAEIPVKYRFSQFWSIVVKPWYEYSEIGRSDDVDLTYYGAVYARAYEPSSRTHQYGLNAGIVFSY